MMTHWTKLTELPGQELRHCKFSKIIFWQIVEGKIVHQGRVNRNADIESFEVLNGSDFIARDKNYIYHAWTRMKSIDAGSFKPVGEGYFQDKSLTYFEYETSLKPIKGGVTESFKVLGNGYARDEFYGYYFGQVIKACESPMRLELAPQTGPHAIFAARDETRVFYERAELKGANPSTWKMIDKGFSTDGDSVYFAAGKLGGVKAKDWQPLTHPYSTNGKDVYYMNWRLPKADLESFEVLEDGTARDKISAFVGRRRAE